ncbi:MAG TPA: fatty acid CoA ligase family protein [Vicinamibacteria bacterium]|nr:fatty acid CoA ligase family protein [Vicinamibacteria bacterium]
MNVADLLADSAQKAPDRDAIIAPDGRGGWTRITYGALDAAVTAHARALKAGGVSRGELTLVMVPPGIPLITLFYGLLRLGAVPVMIDPGMGFRAFLKCVETTRATTIVGIPKAHIARILFPHPFSTIERKFVIGRSLMGALGRSLTPLASAGADAAPVRADLAEDDLAAILFTSGSTGPAKGARYSVGNFFAQRDALQALYNFRPGEVDLAAFPLFSLFDAAFGMTSVIPDINPARPAECRPEKIVEAIRTHKATSAFGSPAIWSRVAPWCATNGVRLDGLKRVLMAGAPVPLKLVRAMRPVLPGDGDVHTPYGATESLPVATISGREVEAVGAEVESGAGTCVGRPAATIELRLIPIREEAVASIESEPALGVGEVGEICVRGGVVTRAYHNREEATLASKIGTGGETWHRMGDLGYRDAQGRLWFCGRKAEAVFTANGPIFTDQVECRFSGDARYPRVALVGMGPRGHMQPVLLIEGPENEALRAEARRIGGIADVRFHPRFPVDRRHNAKIHRLDLAKWAASRSPNLR